MKRTLAVLLVLLLLVPALWAQNNTDKKKELEIRLKNAHEMVRFWWSDYLSNLSIRSYQKLLAWTKYCSNLMEQAKKK